MLTAEARAGPPDQEVILLLLESVIGYFAPEADVDAAASRLLSILLDLAQDAQLFRGLKNDERQRDRVRSIIDGALRAILPR